MMRKDQICEECMAIETKKWCEYHKADETWSECAEKQEIE